MKQSGIARRLLLWFLILALLPMVILTALVHRRSKNDLMAAESRRVVAVANHSINRLERWARERRRSVTNLGRLAASTDAMKSFTLAFDTANNLEGYRKSAEYQKALADNPVIIKHLGFIASQYSYQNIYFVSLGGDVVASVSPDSAVGKDLVKPNSALGKNLRDAPYGETELARAFERVRGKTWPDRSQNGWIEAEITDFRPLPDTEVLAAFIVSPIRDCADNGVCGKPTGVLVVEMPQSAINQAALDNRGMTDEVRSRDSDESFEVLVFSLEEDKVRFVAGKKLQPEAAFQLSIPLDSPAEKRMLPFRQAVQHRLAETDDMYKLGGSGDMIDHEGHDSLAAWRFMKSLPWAVVVTIDKGEAAGPAEAQLKDLLLLGGVMILVVVGLALFVARSIYGPIGRLTQAVRALPSGDFRRRVPVEGDGEIGELSRALNNAMDEVWLLQYVSNAVSEGRGVEHALRTTLEEVCRHAGMLVGHVYETDREACELVSTSIWYLPNPDRFQKFRRVTENLRLALGAGLPGRVLGTGQPEWVEDVKKRDVDHLPAAASEGIEVRGGFAFPVLVGREVTAVLEFYTDQPVASNPALLRMMKTIGTLLGRAIERKREEKLLKEKAAAEAANQAKSAFLASVSHDLRTPLNAIMGFSEMHFANEKDWAGPGAARADGESHAGADGQERWQEEKRVIISDLRKINNAGKDLVRVIDNVLDLTRIEAGRMPVNRDTFDVASVVREVVETDKHVKADKGNRVEVDCPPGVGTMHADQMMVKRILYNLLSNARKFTRQGLIHLSVERRTDGGSEWIVFRVSDTGIGMTPEQMGRIFEPFTQAEKTTKSRYGGTGLGLTVSKNFCKMMGGEISVESEPGRGTTFTVRLPTGVYASHEEDVTDTAEMRVPPEGATVVLVIDDDPAMRELTKHFLGKEGFHVEAAASGEDGLRLARKLHPDVITLDVVMPGMDGYSVASALKADEELRDIPIVMLTIVDEKNQGFPLGVAEYMKKPIDWERLTALLTKYRREADLNCTVLIVEDEEDTREVLRRTLEHDGYEVVTAANGRAALELVARRQPDLILLDLSMPEMDGFEFVKALRRDRRWANIPVAIISVNDVTFEDRIRLDGCVQKFLEKDSYSKEELLREVRDLVSACARRGQAEEAARRT